MHLCGRLKRAREECFTALAWLDTIYSRLLFFAVSVDLKISPCESLSLFPEKVWYHCGNIHSVVFELM